MRTDPRVACANNTEHTGWAFLHDIFAHPLMAISRWSRWSLRFHDFTSLRAWPRNLPPEQLKFFYGGLHIKHLHDGIWSADHPTIDHVYVTAADSLEDAHTKAKFWFDNLFEPGFCKHPRTTPIPVDDQGNWMKCDLCKMRCNRDGWAPSQ